MTYLENTSSILSQPSGRAVTNVTPNLNVALIPWAMPTAKFVLPLRGRVAKGVMRKKSEFLSIPDRLSHFGWRQYHKFAMLCSHCCLSWVMNEIKASSFLKLFRLGSFSNSG